MELIKKNIHMNREKCKSEMTLTLDNDINVMDVKPDINYIVREQGEIKISELKISSGKVLLKGSLLVNVLYIAEDTEEKIQHMEGQIEFNELINMPDICEGDNIYVRPELEDLTTKLINSRKISVKAVVKLIVNADELFDEEVAVSAEGEPYIITKEETGNITNLALNKKDTFRVKEDIILPSGRDSIREILYKQISLYEVETRLMDGQLSLRGEAGIFILYAGVENDRISSFDTTINFSGAVDCNGCSEMMIPYIESSIMDKELQIKEDEDGENRIIEIEMVLGLDMKIYKDEDITILTDMYSLHEKLSPIYKKADFSKLIVKNNSKARVNEIVTLKENNPPILQMSNIICTPKIDEQIVKTDGIVIEGIIDVKMLYFTDDDTNTIAAFNGIVPFSHFIEAAGINENSNYEIIAKTSQVSEVVTNRNEVELKVTLSLDTIVFDSNSYNIITGYKYDEDTEENKNRPGMTGYMVKQNDTMWDIAKEYQTTIENIREVNELESDEIKPGKMLLIIRNSHSLA